MSKSPSNQDRTEFKAYCRALTTPQLHNVYDREKQAKRTVYAEIAMLELVGRIPLPDIDIEELMKGGD